MLEKEHHVTFDQRGEDRNSSAHFFVLFRTNFINAKVAKIIFEICPTLINVMCIITEFFGMILGDFISIDFL